MVGSWTLSVQLCIRLLEVSRSAFMSVTASTKAYRGLPLSRDVCLFVAALHQLQPKAKEACCAAKTFVFLDALLLRVERLRTSTLSELYDEPFAVHTK